MGPGQNLLTWIWSGQFFLLGLGRVSHLWFGVGKFPLNSQIFNFCTLWVKKILTSQKVPGVSFLFAADRKYPPGMSGSISSKAEPNFFLEKSDSNNSDCGMCFSSNFFKNSTF